MGIFDRFRKKNKEEPVPAPAPEPSSPPQKDRAEPVTPGGSRIYRYEEPDTVPQPPQAYGTYAREIEEYFDALFPDRTRMVYHELVSDLVHVDVHILYPTEKDPFYVLYTTGMSDLPMSVPEDIDIRADLEYAELFILLPGDWDLGREEHQLDSDLPYEQFWPIQMLKYFAHFPHLYHTWLGWGHTIPNGPDYAPLCRGCGFGGVVLDALFKPLPTEDGRKINFYWMVPAYKQEIEYKLKYGMESLTQRFRDGKLPIVLDIHRPNLCPDFDEVLDQAP